jgi:PqqD family protein of HPr-rel-A system
MGPTPNWRVLPNSVLHWREWDSEFVVYHENSGDTHRLNAVGACALQRLSEQPLTAMALVSRLSGQFELSGPDLAAVVDDLLARFHDLGLIEPEPQHDASDAVAPGTR